LGKNRPPEPILLSRGLDRNSHNAEGPPYGGPSALADYKALAAKFDPEEFDADAWVKLAKDAGMRYIVITSKHHDGFAMFHSSTDKFNIYDATPFKRDSL
jgi:alpha-L-fucosidase